MNEKKFDFFLEEFHRRQNLTTYTISTVSLVISFFAIEMSLSEYFQLQKKKNITTIFGQQSKVWNKK